MKAVIEPVQLLLRVADLDPAFRSTFLRRAEKLLERELPRAESARLLRLEQHLEEVGRQAAQATDAGDWPKVRNLAQRADRVRAELATRESLLELSRAVYGAPLMTLSPFAAALQGLTNYPLEDLERLRTETVRDFTQLTDLDPDASELYRERCRHFKELRIMHEKREPEASFADERDARDTLREAIRARDWTRAERLANVLASETMSGRASPCQAATTVLRLDEPFPEKAVRDAARMQLAPAKLREAGELAHYVSCVCATRPQMPLSVLSRDERPSVAGACPHPNAPPIEGILRENLDLLMFHPFVNSAGVRYLSHFSTEIILVEDFPEDDVDARGAIGEVLHLPARGGRSRMEIELALQENGDQVLADLGLSPYEFSLICIPFDAYLRLAPERGWGQHAIWTHFDGYQVEKSLYLRALVGGDVRYGGPADLCSVARDYAAPHIVVRFAVVRRARLLTNALAAS